MAMRKEIEEGWRGYLTTEIQDALKGNEATPKFSFLFTDPKAYRDSEIRQLLNRMDAMFTTFIRTLVVERSINDWCDFVRHFTDPSTLLLFSSSSLNFA